MMQNRLFTLIMLISLSLLIPGVYADETKVTNIKVRHDHRFDFGQINKVYSWTNYESKADESGLTYDKEVDSMVVDVINQTLQANGYEEADSANASFGIDYHIVVKEEGTASTHVIRGSRRVNPYTYVNVDGMPTMQDWRKGSLILNVVNLKTGYVVWVGKADALVVNKEDREQLIKQAVSQMLAKFPPK